LYFRRFRITSPLKIIAEKLKPKLSRYELEECCKQERGRGGRHMTSSLTAKETLIRNKKTLKAFLIFNNFLQKVLFEY
jgi:hypothetical protein